MTKTRNKSLREQVKIRDLGLCSICHKDAPDNKKDFYAYMINGGSKTERIFGKFLVYLEEHEMDFHKFYPIFKTTFKALKECDTINSLEKYNIVDSIDIQDVNFDIEIEEYNKEKKKYENPTQTL